jgi:hypothetical protein
MPYREPDYQPLAAPPQHAQDIYRVTLNMLTTCREESAQSNRLERGQPVLCEDWQQKGSAYRACLTFVADGHEHQAPRVCCRGRVDSGLTWIKAAFDCLA